VRQGLLPGYVTCEDSSSVLRGRLLESTQLARHHGQPLPLEIRYDEFTWRQGRRPVTALPRRGGAGSAEA
ncbi:MAG TPA: hypothetical protein VFQ68_39210, partial [Streptosporangiaceae bacterium]|nr:hypothetical protein [Streptosporangiaceae bacterium]